MLNSSADSLLAADLRNEFRGVNPKAGHFQCTGLSTARREGSLQLAQPNLAQICPLGGFQTSCKTSGRLRTKSNNRKAAPVGLRRPFSQLISVTLGTFNNRAKTAWLTPYRFRSATISVGLMGLIGGGNVRVLVRSVSFASPLACRAKASTLATKSSALNSISFRFMV